MLVINYVHKLQGLDKSLPVCLELRHHSGAKVITLVELEPGCHERDVRAFEPLIQACSDTWLILPATRRRRRATPWARLLERWQRRNLPGTRWLDQIRAWMQPQRLRTLLQTLQHSDDRILLLTIYNGVHTALGGWLSRLAARRQGLRVGYLKSLHDQGLGLSDLAGRSSNLTRSLTLRPSLDVLLAPELPEFRTLLQRKGVAPEQMVVAGYPPAYPRWQALIRDSMTREEPQSTFRVVLFSRGEVAHKPADQQVIDEAWLVAAIHTLAEELERLWPEHVLWIKPHPYQQRRNLERICEQRARVQLVDGPPALLAAGADLAVATYSSAILDAVAAGVPSIEWFSPTPAFHRLHPDGSPFPAFGVRRASQRQELRALLETLAAGQWPTCDTINKLGTQLDLKSLNRSLNQQSC